VAMAAAWAPSVDGLNQLLNLFRTSATANNEQHREIQQVCPRSIQPAPSVRAPLTGAPRLLVARAALPHSHAHACRRQQLTNFNSIPDYNNYLVYILNSLKDENPSVRQMAGLVRAAPAGRMSGAALCRRAQHGRSGWAFCRGGTVTRGAALPRCGCLGAHAAIGRLVAWRGATRRPRPAVRPSALTAPPGGIPVVPALAQVLKNNIKDRWLQLPGDVQSYVKVRRRLGGEAACSAGVRPSAQPHALTLAPGSGAAGRLCAEGKGALGRTRVQALAAGFAVPACC